MKNRFIRQIIDEWNVKLERDEVGGKKIGLNELKDLARKIENYLNQKNFKRRYRNGKKNNYF